MRTKRSLSYKFTSLHPFNSNGTDLNVFTSIWRSVHLNHFYLDFDTFNAKQVILNCFCSQYTYYCSTSKFHFKYEMKLLLYVEQNRYTLVCIEWINRLCIRPGEEEKETNKKTQIYFFILLSNTIFIISLTPNAASKRDKN